MFRIKKWEKYYLRLRHVKQLIYAFNLWTRRLGESNSFNLVEEKNKLTEKKKNKLTGLKGAT